MKKILSILFICSLLNACAENKTKESEEQEETTAPAPDNSNATNPSLPDTVYSDSVR